MMNSFGRKDRELGCGFLSAREVDAWVEGRLSARRLGRFERHRADGCEDCLLLEASLERFRAVTEHGVLDTERAAFEKTRLVVRARLRQEIDRLEADRPRAGLFGIGRNLSPNELEQIAAAGTPDLDKANDDDEDGNEQA